MSYLCDFLLQSPVIRLWLKVPVLFIAINPTDSTHDSAPIEERLRQLDKFAAEHPGTPVSSYLRELIPEVSVIDAVNELRQQLHGEPVRAKTCYPGKRSGVDPIAFVMEQYGDEIREGRLGPGQLHVVDASLYMTLRAVLMAQNPPKTVGQFFDEHTANEKRGGVFRRRIDACCEILAGNEEETTRFLQNVNVNRIRPTYRVNLTRSR